MNDKIAVAKCKPLSRYGCDEAYSSCEWIKPIKCSLKARKTENKEEKLCNMFFDQTSCLASLNSNCEWIEQSHTSSVTSDDQNKPVLAGKMDCNEPVSEVMAQCTHKVAFKENCDAIYQCKLHNFEIDCKTDSNC